MKTILKCCYCGKIFKTKEPILNVCNKCCKKNIKFLEDLKSDPIFWSRYFECMSKYKK